MQTGQWSSFSLIFLFIKGAYGRPSQRLNAGSTNSILITSIMWIGRLTRRNSVTKSDLLR